jgi:hypothetical protein
MTCCNRAAGGMFNRTISPGQDLLEHKDPNGSAQRPNAMAPRTLEWHEAHGAVDLSDQGSHGSLVFEGDQPQLVPELMLDGDRCPLPSNPDGVLEGELKSP